MENLAARYPIIIQTTLWDGEKSMKHKEILDQMGLVEKIGICTGANYWRTKSIERFGIPSFLMTDGPHGLRKLMNSEDVLGQEATHPATSFPTASLTACSWDRGLITDDTAAIQIALNAASVTGGEVYAPKGDYL